MDPHRARLVLGVGAGASAEEIDQAFRSVAARSHPDRGGDDEAFRAAVEARAVLKRVVLTDPGSRPEVRIMPRRSFRWRLRDEIERRQRKRREPRFEQPGDRQHRDPLR